MTVKNKINLVLILLIILGYFIFIYHSDMEKESDLLNLLSSATNANIAVEDMSKYYSRNKNLKGSSLYVCKVSKQHFPNIKEIKISEFGYVYISGFVDSEKNKSFEFLYVFNGSNDWDCFGKPYQISKLFCKNDFSNLVYPFFDHINWVSILVEENSQLNC